MHRNSASELPPLNDNHDPAATERQRASVVQKAKRSPAARAKAARQRTDDDLPVHSSEPCSPTLAP